jgi:hypothetical protein
MTLKPVLKQYLRADIFNTVEEFVMLGSGLRKDQYALRAKEKQTYLRLKQSMSNPTSSDQHDGVKRKIVNPVAALTK